MEANKEEIFRAQAAFGLRGEVQTIQRNVWRLCCVHGDYALKRSELTEERLAFITAAQFRLARNGFTDFALPLLTADRQPYYCDKNGALYTVNDWIHGERCDFDAPDQLTAAGQTLGRFHLLARGLTGTDGCRRHWLEWPHTLRIRCHDLLRFYDLCGNSRPDCLCRSLLPHSYEQALRARRLLLSGDYERLARESVAVGQFIHYDVAARNFVNSDGRACLIDFDYCACDLPAVDLMRLLRRGLKHGNDAEARIKALLDGYTRSRPLSREELDTVAALLLFPQKLWRLCSRYFDGGETPDAGKLLAAGHELDREAQWSSLLRSNREVQ